MDNIYALNKKSNDESYDLVETYYCDFSNIEIKKAAKDFLEHKENTRELVTKIFLFVRDKIIFGGDGRLKLLRPLIKDMVPAITRIFFWLPYCAIMAYLQNCVPIQCKKIFVRLLWVLDMQLFPLRLTIVLQKF